MLQEKPLRADAVGQLAPAPRQEHRVLGYRSQSHFAQRLLGALSRELHGLVNDVEASSLRSGAQRVVGYRLRDFQGVTADGTEGELKLPIGKGVFAPRLTLTPQHFSRIPHELTAQGLITAEGRKVRFVDLQRLLAYD